MTAAEVERNRLETEWGRSRRLYEQKMIATETYDQATAARNVAAERYRQMVQQYDLVKQGPRREEIDQAAAALAQAKAQYELVRKGPRQETIDQARANVRQAAAALTMAQVKLSYAKVYSPLNGVVLSKNIEPGEYVAPGTPVVTVADLDNIWLRAYVDEMDLDLVKLNQAAEITTDSKPGKTYAGRVGFIASEAEFTPKTVQTEKERVKLVYRIKIDITNRGQELKPGMPADASLKERGLGIGRKEKNQPVNLRPSSFLVPSSSLPNPQSLIPFYDRHPRRASDETIRRPHGRRWSRSGGEGRGNLRAGGARRRRENDHDAAADGDHGPDLGRRLGGRPARRPRGRGDQRRDRLHEPAIRPVRGPHRDGEPEFLRRHLQRPSAGAAGKGRAAAGLQQPGPVSPPSGRQSVRRDEAETRPGLRR